jgi:hypothetical protein
VHVRDAVRDILANLLAHAARGGIDGGLGHVLCALSEDGSNHFSSEFIEAALTS